MKVLVFGGSGLVGSRFIQLNKKVFEILAPQIWEVDILNKDRISQVFEQFGPDIVINFAAFTDVQGAEKQKGDKSGICYQINANGAKNVAEACENADKKLIHISTEYVFDGTKSNGPYKEEDEPKPVNWYGQTKHFGDQFVLESGCNFVIVRISMPYSASYELKKDIARFFLGHLQNKIAINAISDQKITPTITDDVASALAVLINQKASGIYNVCSKNPTTPLEFARFIAQIFALDLSLIKSISLDEYNENKKAKLLKYSWLDPSKFTGEFGMGILHTVEESIEFFKQEIDRI